MEEKNIIKTVGGLSLATLIGMSFIPDSERHDMNFWEKLNANSAAEQVYETINNNELNKEHEKDFMNCLNYNSENFGNTDIGQCRSYAHFRQVERMGLQNVLYKNDFEEIRNKYNLDVEYGEN